MELNKDQINNASKHLRVCPRCKMIYERHGFKSHVYACKVPNQIQMKSIHSNKLKGHSNIIQMKGGSENARKEKRKS